MTGVPHPRALRRSIALIGLRGAGKSTVAKELARLFGVGFIDTDDLVAAEAKRSIAAIFADEGEAGFRQRERRVIARLVDLPPAIFSVGGGAVLDSKNVRSLRSVADVVWLRAEPTVLWERVRDDPGTGSQRPPLTDQPGLIEMQELAIQRRSYYEQAADLVVDTTNCEPPVIANQIAEAFGTKP